MTSHYVFLCILAVYVIYLLFCLLVDLYCLYVMCKPAYIVFPLNVMPLMALWVLRK